MLRMPHRIRRRALGAALAPALLVLGCESGPVSGPVAGPGESVGLSRAFGIWSPGPQDTCSKADHDRYAVVGPDGLLYPTWHPPTDPASGCSFGHEHGRDPSGSALFAQTGPIPFGYANSVLDAHDPSAMRHEDHVGHKIEWENDMPLHFESGADAGIRCDVLTKLHQGTHSKDAFTNNLHELAYHIRCSDTTELHVTLLTPIGAPGEFTPTCERETRVFVGPATPATSPQGRGKRVLPNRSCVEQHILVPDGERSRVGPGLRESWQTSNQIRREGGRLLAAFNPYFQVISPSRFHDPASPDGVGRTIDLCYEAPTSGERARSRECAEVLRLAAGTRLAWDDPRSPFNGVRRVVDINRNRIANADGPDVWYTDPFGGHARPEPFPGSIRQFIARVDNSALVLKGPVIGRDRFYGGPGVHAPN